MKLNISVFFPALNEEKNIEVLVDSAYAILNELAGDFEIIIIDDGSQDKTPAIVQQLAARYPRLKLIRHPKNLGYGAALTAGFKNCRYELVFFSDADNQFDLKELRHFLPLIGHCDAVIGYRKKREDSYLRSLNAWCWTGLVNILFKLKIRDVNCAFKLFKKSALDKIKVERLSSHGALINTEILACLRRSNAKIIQVPVSHYPRRHGKQTGANLKVILRAFAELINFYFNGVDSK